MGVCNVCFERQAVFWMTSLSVVNQPEAVTCRDVREVCSWPTPAIRSPYSSIHPPHPRPPVHMPLPAHDKLRIQRGQCDGDPCAFFVMLAVP